jgi:hypothetical protein
MVEISSSAEEERAVRCGQFDGLGGARAGAGGPRSPLAPNNHLAMITTTALTIMAQIATTAVTMVKRRSGDVL